jgi:hypothetical protein
VTACRRIAAWTTRIRRSQDLGLFERAVVVGDDPFLRLVPVVPHGPFPGQPPQVAVDGDEGAFGDHRPVIGLSSPEGSG